MLRRFRVFALEELEARHDARPFDLFVYHVGGAADAGMLPLMRRHPGVVVLHGAAGPPPDGALGVVTDPGRCAAAMTVALARLDAGDGHWRADTLNALADLPEPPPAAWVEEWAGLRERALHAGEAAPARGPRRRPRALARRSAAV